MSTGPPQNILYCGYQFYLKAELPGTSVLSPGVLQNRSLLGLPAHC